MREAKTGDLLLVLYDMVGINEIGLDVVQCSPCSHWSLDDNEHMFCDWYGANCSEIDKCPVRTVDMMQGQKRLAWQIFDLISLTKRVGRNKARSIYLNKK